MPFKVNIEFLLHLKKFFNVDMFYLGGYFFKFSIYQLQNSEKIYAIPYSFATNKTGQKKDVFLNDPKLSEEEFSVSSQIFKIKNFYSVEENNEIELNNFFQFKLEIDAYPNVNYKDIYLECELFYSDLENQKENGSYTFSKKMGKKFLIKNIVEGLNEFFPIITTGNYFSCTEATLHSCCIDITNFIKKGNKQPNNFPEFIKQLCPNFNFEEIKHFYNLYIDQLKENYKNLCFFANQISEKFEEKEFPKPFLNNFDDVIIQKLTSPSEKNKINIDFCHLIINEINQIAGIIYQSWNNFIQILKENPWNYIDYLKEKNQKKTKNYLDSNIFRNKYFSEKNEFNLNQINPRDNKMIANNLRKRNSGVITGLKENKIFDEIFSAEKPIFFEEIYMKNEKDFSEKCDRYIDNLVGNRNNNNNNNSLVVLVHGFQGNQYDLRYLKNYLLILYPHLYFLVSSINELNTSAKEIEDYLQFKNIDKINFIGFSMGGIIIRSALPNLKMLENKMGWYVSLSSPHLGYMVNSSKLIDAGMWFLKTVGKCKCMEQLAMTDSKSLEDTFLYKLSKKEVKSYLILKGLNWFENLYFFGSHQDEYCPFDSARIQCGAKQYFSKNNKYQIHHKMAENLLSNAKALKIHRIDVNFKISKRNIDSFIGRAAHLQFLENDLFLQSFCYCFDYLFD